MKNIIRITRIVIVFTCILYSITSSAQISPGRYFDTARVDINTNPPTVKLKFRTPDWYVSSTTLSTLNDSNNTQILRFVFGGCRNNGSVFTMDTTLNIPARLPFDLKVHLSLDPAAYCYMVYSDEELEVDSLLIRYNQIVSTDDANALNEQLNVAPNPNNGAFTLQHDANIQIQSATIYNSQGALIQKITDVGDKIEMPTTTKGIYFLRLQTNQGEVVKKIFLE